MLNFNFLSERNENISRLLTMETWFRNSVVLIVWTNLLEFYMHLEVLLGLLDVHHLKTVKANMYVAIALLFEVPPFLSFIGSFSFISWIILDMLLMTQFSLIVVFPTEIIMRFSREHVNWAPHTFYSIILSSYFRREMKVLWSKPKGSQTNPITISVSCTHAHLKWKKIALSKKWHFQPKYVSFFQSGKDEA